MTLKAYSQDNGSSSLHQQCHCAINESHTGFLPGSVSDPEVIPFTIYNELESHIFNDTIQSTVTLPTDTDSFLIMLKNKTSLIKHYECTDGRQSCTQAEDN